MGKTTLVREVLKNENAGFFNFDVEIENTRFLAAASLSPAEGLRTLGNPAILVLDEAQRLPNPLAADHGCIHPKDSMRLLIPHSSFRMSDSGTL